MPQVRYFRFWKIPRSIQNFATSSISTPPGYTAGDYLGRALIEFRSDTISVDCQQRLLIQGFHLAYVSGSPASTLNSIMSICDSRASALSSVNLEPFVRAPPLPRPFRIFHELDCLGVEYGLTAARIGPRPVLAALVGDGLERIRSCRAIA
jgi:hypothetical protein